MIIDEIRAKPPDSFAVKTPRSAARLKRYALRLWFYNIEYTMRRFLLLWLN